MDVTPHARVTVEGHVSWAEHVDWLARGIPKGPQPALDEGLGPQPRDADLVLHEQRTGTLKRRVPST